MCIQIRENTYFENSTQSLAPASSSLRPAPPSPFHLRNDGTTVGRSDSGSDLQIYKKPDSRNFIKKNNSGLCVTFANFLSVPFFQRLYRSHFDKYFIIS